jgi:hypothetical protein
VKSCSAGCFLPVGGEFCGEAFPQYNVSPAISGAEGSPAIAAADYSDLLDVLKIDLADACTAAWFVLT